MNKERMIDLIPKLLNPDEISRDNRRNLKSKSDLKLWNLNEIWWEYGNVLKLMKSLGKIAVLQNWPKLNMKDKLSLAIKMTIFEAAANEKGKQAGVRKKGLSCVWIALFQPKSDDVMMNRYER